MKIKLTVTKTEDKDKEDAEKGMIITVDTNAAEDAVFAALQVKSSDVNTPIIELRRERLDVGDVWICDNRDEHLGGIVLERKTWSDFGASICDGRLHEQKARMIDPKVHYAYVIEGGTVEHWDGFYRGSMRQKCMWAAIVKMQMRDGFCVFHTNSSKDTAALALYLAQQIREDGFTGNKKLREVVAGVQKRKRDNLSDPINVLLAMLTIIPGMSPVKADVVIKAFPTVAGLMEASNVEIATLSCGSRTIGPKLAQAIKAVFS